MDRGCLVLVVLVSACLSCTRESAVSYVLPSDQLWPISVPNLCCITALARGHGIFVPNVERTRIGCLFLHPRPCLCSPFQVSERRVPSLGHRQRLRCRVPCGKCGHKPPPNSSIIDVRLVVLRDFRVINGSGLGAFVHNELHLHLSADREAEQSFCYFRRGPTYLSLSSPTFISSSFLPYIRLR